MLCAVPTLSMMHTSEVDTGTLSAIRALLTGAFAPPEFTDADWEHTLGGLHVLCHEDDELIGHAAVIQRRLLHRGRALRAGYVESVVVRADRRRRGHGSAMMDELERIISKAYDVGALNSSEMAKPFYASRRWQPWLGPLAALTPSGVRPTEQPDSVHVLLGGPVVPDVGELLVCDWRDGNPW
jgi:aminoglycoside 2'-N-acetyltransferase I